nr:YndM family protein [Lysinibacillus timonensis]
MGKPTDKANGERKNLYMKYTKAFFIKLVMTIGVLWVVLGLFFNVSFGDIFVIGTVLTLIAFVGDMFLLPKMGNVLAAVTDLALAFLIVWALGGYLFDDNISLLSAAFLASLFIWGGELYYHRYLRDHVFTNVEQTANFTPVNRQLQTEFSEEFDKDLDKHRNDKES